MIAYEFETMSKNGVIEVPERCRRELDEIAVKVIVIKSEQIQRTAPMKFDAIRLKTKGFVFDREEAHERQGISGH